MTLFLLITERKSYGYNRVQPEQYLVRKISVYDTSSGGQGLDIAVDKALDLVEDGDGELTRVDGHVKFRYEVGAEPKHAAHQLKRCLLIDVERNLVHDLLPKLRSLYAQDADDRLRRTDEKERAELARLRAKYEL